MTTHLPEQKLLFVLGKGGVGRSTISGALARNYSTRGQSVLIVQWAVQDAISPQFGQPQLLEHKAHAVESNISTMNYAPDEAMKEYFVDHLGLKLLHSMVVENKHVKRLVQAAPGVQELFFLGRLYWLVALAERERGWSYDKIIVDAPAMGHGVSLFKIAPTIASMGIAGPLAIECERVTKMLFDPSLVGTIVVTIPEELPVEETAEFLPKIEAELGRPPLFVVLNRAFTGELESRELDKVLNAVSSDAAKAACSSLARDLSKREGFAKLLNEIVTKTATPLVRTLDAHLLFETIDPEKVCLSVAAELGEAMRN